jgi:two-component system sensor histidine kinase TctE
MLWVLLPQFILWIAGGFFTYRLAVRYVDQAADATLSQAARTLARQVKPIDNGLLIDFPRAAQEVLEADPSDRFLYSVSTPPAPPILGNHRIPLPPASVKPRPNEPYFYDGEVQLESADAAGARPGPSKIRIVALYVMYGNEERKDQLMLVQIARSMVHRETIWQNILIDTLLPLSALILLMTMIVWVGTGVGLAPLLRLRRQVEGRSATDLTPLRIDAAPPELRSLVRALNDLLASVRQNVSAQQRFIADAAHQLRTPLAGLKGQAEVAIGMTDDPALRARLGMLHQSAVQGAHLINRLLMLARAEPEAAMMQEKREIDLVAFVQEEVAGAVPKALRAGVDLGMSEPDASLESGPVRIRADAMLLREAFRNILDNAMEYAGSGCEVTVRVARDAHAARIVVSDNGPGIPDADRPRVFERFVRATDHGHGCGLGLSIVKEILTRHGGTVELEAATPHGLRVILRLPLA